MSEPQKPKNTHSNRSPHAMPLPEEEEIPEAPRPEERVDFFSDRSMSPWRRRNVGRPSAR